MIIFNKLTNKITWHTITKYKKWFLIKYKKNFQFKNIIKIIITKKKIKLAYQRNKIKRLITENYRIYKKKIPSIIILFIINKHFLYLTKKNLFFLLHKIWSYKY